MLRLCCLFVISFFAFLQLVAHPAWGIVVDENRNIYFADIAHHQRGAVWKLTAEGELKLLLRNFHAHNVSLDKEGRLVTSHGENTQRLIRINLDGSLDTLFQSTNFQDFNGGNSTYSLQGNIFFQIDHYVWKIDADGQKTKHHPQYLKWNQTIYVDQEETIYVVDIGIGNGVIYQLYPDGKSSVLATDLISTLDRPKDKHMDILLGITKGCDGFLYVAETAGQRIVKILPDQKVATFYQAPADWTPTGIDFFAGEAYILEYRGSALHIGPRIVKIDEGGNATELFNYDTYQSQGVLSPNAYEQTYNHAWSLWLLTAVVLLGFGWVLRQHAKKVEAL